jgi:hypothetical protein
VQLILENLHQRMMLSGLCVTAMLLAFAPLNATAEEKAAADGTGQLSLGQVGHKLANPLGNLWNLSMNFEAPKFYDGDLNAGDPEIGADMIFQPVLPIPLWGEGNATWRMITRPIIPLIFSTPVPQGFDDFDHRSGIGDIQLPLLLSFPESVVGKMILGVGPLGSFPSATNDDLGSDQWGLGGAFVVGYKAKDWTTMVFPNYFWKVGEAGQGDKPDLSSGSLLYAFIYDLGDAWQVGTNPTITYNHAASDGNKWNVPIGLMVGKTIKMGKMPVNIKLIAEYSVVSEDDFGKRATIRLQITPVLPAWIQNPLFGK